ncbi:uncharacterized protein LOC112086564 [Eutrema salsugineum]|uniref:uncharacterized protein LOC112086564 n=1 Tax=Eutrema salsugineum TaxID=72664 RepID=UPI000CED0F6A|nr:uncharacterized protein LOC112086564 [Eutrema salsugineum]
MMMEKEEANGKMHSGKQYLRIRFGRQTRQDDEDFMIATKSPFHLLSDEGEGTTEINEELEEASDKVDQCGEEDAEEDKKVEENHENLGTEEDSEATGTQLQADAEEFLCSRVYASNFEEDMKVLWDDLRSHSHSPIFGKLCWMIMGDFNEIFQGRSPQMTRHTLVQIVECLLFKICLESAVFRTWVITLKELKGVIKQISRDSLQILTAKVKERYKDLCQKQEMTLLALTPDNQREESNALERWEHVSKLEEGYLKQKSKLHWLNVGDRCTKVFHHAVKAREAKNRIREIRNSNGDMVTAHEEIKVEAAKFFEDFLNTEPTELVTMEEDVLADMLGIKCSAMDHDFLVREVSEKEIHDVLFAMTGGKFPDPDGYTVEFYKKHGGLLRMILW